MPSGELSGRSPRTRPRTLITARKAARSQNATAISAASGALAGHRVVAIVAEVPDHDRRSEDLDDRVEAERDERQRTGLHTERDRDDDLHRVPAVGGPLETEAASAETPRASGASPPHYWRTWAPHLASRPPRADSRREKVPSRCRRRWFRLPGVWGASTAAGPHGSISSRPWLCYWVCAWCPLRTRVRARRQVAWNVRRSCIRLTEPSGSHSASPGVAR